jgi:hypothetical protein
VGTKANKDTRLVTRITKQNNEQIMNSHKPLFHKKSRRIENEVFIMYMPDHELVTAANLRKVPIVSIFGMGYLWNKSNAFIKILVESRMKFSFCTCQIMN